MKGIVLKSTGSNYLVRIADGTIFPCKLKGKLRLEGRKTTNPVTVGDMVGLEKSGSDEYLIAKIDKRKNYIIRKSVNLSKQTHILASNMDQAILVATLVEPRTSMGFIDRFLITAEAYRIPAIIIFNKSDLLSEQLLAIQHEIMAIYKNAGYETMAISSLRENDVAKVKKILRNKCTLISGHSGVGKSTLINALQPGLNIKTGEISATHLKGTHTTTFAEMHKLDFGGDIIDTPGIKELGLVEMKKEELGHYFPEIRALMNRCKFNNCLHYNEPACAVREAYDSDTISPERYESYISILNSDEMDWKEWENR